MSSAILAASALAGVVIPRRVGEALDTDVSPPRARAEFRIAYGAMTGVGVWGVMSGEAAAFAAVGFLWLGAAAVRVLSLVLDRPRADWTYWTYLAAEAGLATAALLSV